MVLALLRHVDDHGDLYDAIAIWCPGCERADGQGGLHMLPVTGDGSKHPVWTWNGDLENVTLEPSILTHQADAFVCHSFLRDGQWQFLGDSTHSLAGQTVPMVPLPDWVTG
jgi:hypothetical protein